MHPDRSHPQRAALAVAPFLLFAASGLRAQVDPDVAAQIRREGLENSQVMEILAGLTGDVGHRLTGSDNFTHACEWAKAKFESFGIPHVELEKWATWPVVWNREQWQGRIVEPEALELQVATEAWTNGTLGRVRGPIRPMPTDAEELEALGDAIDGAWLFGQLPSRRSGFLEELLEGTTGRVAGFLYASRGDDRYPNRMRVFGSFPRSDDIADTPPRIMIRRDQAEQISEWLEAGQEVVADFDIRNRWRKEPVDLHNVIAEIPGTEFPDEYVYVCGHLDSWHQATGTTDNGTGTSSTLEAARILAAVGARPRRTIRFALWGGEEQGLLGSRRHTVINRSSMDRVSAVFNHDTGTNWAHALRVNDAALPMVESVIEPIMALTPPDADFDGEVFALSGVPQLSSRGGSDHASFVGVGVPAFSWGLTGRSDYFRYTWHTQWDSYDVAIPEYMRHTSTVVALMALGIANLPEKLPREGVQRSQGNDLKPIIEGMLGVTLGGNADLNVQAVKEEGRGAQMGLKQGDRIVAIRGTNVRRLIDLRAGMRRSSGDEAEATLTVERDGERVALPLRR